MLGAALGDVVGSVYEFNNTKDYNFKMFSSQSDITDDTILTMAVAEWAMDDKTLSHEKLEQYLVSFASDFPDPMGGYGGSFETWLFRPELLADYSTGEHASKRCPYNSWGNGSAMRVSAVGWLFDTLEETERVAEISASITHNHPEGIKGAQAVAAAVFLARKGSDKNRIKQYIEERFHYDLNLDWNELHRTYAWESGCQGTVPPAIVAFLESSDFEDAIRKAISLGGDSDTLGCITGAIAEAYYQEIPLFMLDKVMYALPERLQKVLDRFGKTAYSVCYDKYVSLFKQPAEFTPDRISTLAPGEVFVFGSNLEGLHGGGAARIACDKFGAEWGVGVGMTGQCYAIPTMQGGVETIRPYTDEFIAYARIHPEYKFYVTRIGCGIAGFRDEEIAPLFRAALSVHNIILPKSFYQVIKGLIDNK